MKTLESKIENPKSAVDLNADKISEIVQEKLGNIFNASGISSCENTRIEGVKGNGPDPVFHIQNRDTAYALKIFSHSTNQNHFRANLKFNQLASENEIPVAPLVHSDADSKILPAPWILWKWVPGQLLFRMETNKERSATAEKVGKALRNMHAIEVSGFGWPTADDEWAFENASGACDFFAKRIRNLTEKGGRAFSDEELREIFSLTAESEELRSFENPRLLHGDITGGNVVVSNVDSLTFVDPGEIVAGDSMADLGYSQTTMLRSTFRDGVWNGYTENNPLSLGEEIRFKKWRLLRQCVVACNAVLNKNKNAQKYIEDVLTFLEEVRK